MRAPHAAASAKSENHAGLSTFKAKTCEGRVLAYFPNKHPQGREPHGIREFDGLF